MKVAVVFFGFWRTFPYVQETFRQYVMEPLDADIFFSSPKTMFALTQNEVPEWHYFHSASERLVENDIVEFFGSKLKSYELWEHNADVYKHDISLHGVGERDFANQHTFRMASQLHSRELSINLFERYVKQHNVRYDMVIMARGDVKYYTYFDIGSIDLGKINYPTHCWTNGNLGILHPSSCPSDKLHKAFNDQMLVGSQDNMLAYTNIYSKSFEYAKEGIHYNTETLLGHHLYKSNIDWAGSNFIEYELWRHEKY